MLKPAPPIKSPDEADASDVALRALFDQEESALLRYVFSLVGRREVAEEIVQEMFLQLHRRWQEVEAPRAWLYRAARNRALNWLRDNKREVLNGDSVSESADAGEETPEASLHRMEALAALRNSLEQLSEQDRELVRLKYFENLKYREISERTGLTVSNVGYRLHHILKDLASKLRPLGIDETP